MRVVRVSEGSFPKMGNRLSVGDLIGFTDNSLARLGRDLQGVARLVRRGTRQF